MKQNGMTNVTFRGILEFTVPTIIMMVFMSMYQMVDAIFVSNYVSTDALSALNIVYPPISLIIALAVMLGTGGNAIIAKTMGEGNLPEARRQFSWLVLVGIAIGAVLMLVGLWFTSSIVDLLGATEKIHRQCVEYLFILLLTAPLSILQMLFQSFFVTAGKPKLGLVIVVLAGITNIGADYILIVKLGLGITGAALGTALGYAIPSLFGLCYFSWNKKGVLYFVKPRCSFSVLWESSFNGSSEMVTNLANAVTTFLFNYMMLRYMAEDGVAAITIVLYAQFFLSAVFIGYSMGVAPMISYNYGKQDPLALKKLFRVSIFFIAANALVWFGASLFLKNVLIGIFAPYGSKIFQIAQDGWNLFALSFLLSGFNIFSSALFTAFSDGLVSAVISLLRTFLFLAGSILLLPQVLGITGIWLAVPAAELFTLVFSALFLWKYRNKYHYL